MVPSMARGAADEVDGRRDRLLALYDAEWAGLVRLAHLLTGSVHTAEDLVQEAFVRAYDALDEVRDPRAYMRRVVVNLTRSHHRRRGVEQRWRDRQPPPRPVLDADVDDTWHRLQHLNEDQRHALVLRFYLDMTVPAVAEALGRPVGTVKSDIHRGLARLAEEVTP